MRLILFFLISFTFLKTPVLEASELINAQSILSLSSTMQSNDLDKLEIYLQNKTGEVTSLSSESFDYTSRATIYNLMIARYYFEKEGLKKAKSLILGSLEGLNEAIFERENFISEKQHIEDQRDFLDKEYEDHATAYREAESGRDRGAAQASFEGWKEVNAYKLNRLKNNDQAKREISYLKKLLEISTLQIQFLESISEKIDDVSDNTATEILNLYNDIIENAQYLYGDTDLSNF